MENTANQEMIAPYRIENYDNMQDTQNPSKAPTLPMLITFQLNRIDALRTLPTNTTNGYTQETLAHCIYRGLRSIESKLSPYLKKEGKYYDEVAPIKEKLKRLSNTDITAYNDALADWEDTLIGYFGHLNLLPPKDQAWELE